MKSRLFSELPDDQVPRVFSSDGSTPVKGRHVISIQDEVGYTLYEIRAEPGDQLVLKSPEGPIGGNGFNHIYYNLDGKGEIKIDQSSEIFKLERNAVVALSPEFSARYKASGSSRVLVIHCLAADDTAPGHPPPTYRRLSEITATDRDVDWFRGRSRRFLVKQDGFNLSLHNTIAYPGKVSPLWYQKNIEAAYYIRGDVRYMWDEGRSEADFRQEDVADGDGWLILMDQHDPHVLHALSLECEVVCIFYPPLKGNETHDFSGKGHSSF